MKIITLHQISNRLLLVSFAFLMMSCNQATHIPVMAQPLALLHDKPNLADSPTSSYIFKDELYTLEVKIEKTAKDQYQLVMDMDLKHNSYFISPNAKRDFTGKFTLEVKGDGHVETIGKLKETPLSVEEYDSHPFTNGLVNWVREDTVYRQDLNITSTGDFVIGAGLIFTIEPRCTLEKKYFLISYKNGVLSVDEDGC